jgi:hypothetical protein
VVAFAQAALVHRLSRLHPILRDSVRSIFDELDAKSTHTDWRPLLASTVRSPTEQLSEYSRGRMLEKDLISGGFVSVQVGRVTTRDLPWQSPHVFRVAADIALVSRHSQQWLEPSDPTWNWLEELAAKYKLVHRAPEHIELAGWRDFVGMDALNRVREMWPPK